jgi:murein L,D-transpeptidase YcbB/YkuD
VISFRVSEAVQRAGRRVRPARFFAGSGAVLTAAALAMAPASAPAAPAVSVSSAAAALAAPPGATEGQSVADFYAARRGQPLWFAAGNEQAASDLLMLLNTAALDGLNPKRYRTRDLQRAMRSAWGGNPAARQRAEMLLSQAFATYVRDLRQPPDVGMIYVDPQLRSQPPSSRAALQAAATAPSLPQYMAAMGWMHPFYGQLRGTLSQTDDARERALLTVNMERVRLLPAADAGRYVLVNAAGQRLYMFNGNEVQDTMRVVVGKPAQPTPMMAALIRFTSLNPYWNVPPDLVAERIAPYVLKQGPSYLRAKGYQVLSDWGSTPKVISPTTIDWQAVATGRKEIRVRQLPGPANSMGDMKFMFPNAQGIYLHDTPSTELFGEASRFFSGGCVRLEAAPRLANWLYGKPLRAKGARPEQKVSLPQPVPVYLTYLTAVPSGGGQVAFFDDSYQRDATRLAQLSRGKRGFLR